MSGYACFIQMYYVYVYIVTDKYCTYKNFQLNRLNLEGSNLGK